MRMTRKVRGRVDAGKGDVGGGELLLELRRITVGTPSGPVSYPAPPRHDAGTRRYGAVPAVGEHTDKVRAEFSLSAAKVGNV